MYTRSVQFSSILAQISLNCVGFTEEFTWLWYHPGTVQFQTGSLSYVNPFGTGQENRSGADLPGPVYMQGLSIPISYQFQ